MIFNYLKIFGKKNIYGQDIHNILVPGLLKSLGTFGSMVIFALRSSSTDFGTGDTYSEL